MPNRILREGILTSEGVNELTWEEEVFYRRLMSVADDHGRFPAHPAILRAALYPMKLDSVREANMDRLLAACAKARLVRLYSVAGKRYIEVVKFRQRVRAPSKYPDPPPDDGQMTVICQSNDGLGGGGGVVKGGVEDGDGSAQRARSSDWHALLPEGLNTDRFKEAWERYLKFRKEQKHKPLGETSTGQKFREMAEWGEAVAIEQINLSIANGWQGIFAPKPGRLDPAQKKTTIALKPSELPKVWRPNGK